MTTAAQQHATIAQVRQNMVANCRWAVTNHKHINYAEIRPWPIIPPRTLPFTTDCSGFAEMMARWSGAADPSGAGFDGSGNTDTMLAHSHAHHHGRRLSPVTSRSSASTRASTWSS